MSAVALHYTPPLRWPAPGTWIHFMPPAIFEAGKLPRDLLSEGGREAFELITLALRLKAEWEQWAKTFTLPRSPIVNGRSIGNCLSPWLTSGVGFYVEPFAEPKDGDIVQVVLTDEALDAFLSPLRESEEEREKYEAIYGHVPSHRMLKVYRVIDGREVLMNRQQAHVLNGSRIVGVVRTMELQEMNHAGQ